MDPHSKIVYKHCQTGGSWRKCRAPEDLTAYYVV